MILLKHIMSVLSLALLAIISCGNQPDPTKTAALVASVHDSLPPVPDTSLVAADDSLWFSLDTVPDLIAAQFKRKAEIRRTKVLKDVTYHRKGQIVQNAVLKIDGHRVGYTAFFKEGKEGDGDQWGETRSDNFISAKIIFDQKEFDVRDIEIIDIYPKSGDTYYPITFAPEGIYLTDSVYRKIQLEDIMYYVVPAGPHACRCSYYLYFIFELNVKTSEVKVVALYEEDNVFLDSSAVSCGDCNDDGILDFYINYDVDGRRGNYVIFVPVTLDKVNGPLLNGFPIYYLGWEEEAGKIFTGDPYSIIGKK